MLDIFAASLGDMSVESLFKRRSLKPSAATSSGGGEGPLPVGHVGSFRVNLDGDFGWENASVFGGRPTTTSQKWYVFPREPSHFQSLNMETQVSVLKLVPFGSFPSHTMPDPDKGFTQENPARRTAAEPEVEADDKVTDPGMDTRGLSLHFSTIFVETNVSVIFCTFKKKLGSQINMFSKRGITKGEAQPISGWKKPLWIP